MSTLNTQEYQCELNRTVEYHQIKHNELADNFRNLKSECNDNAAKVEVHKEEKTKYYNRCMIHWGKVGELEHKLAHEMRRRESRCESSPKR